MGRLFLPAYERCSATCWGRVTQWVGWVFVWLFGPSQCPRASLPSRSTAAGADPVRLLRNSKTMGSTCRLIHTGCPLYTGLQAAEPHEALLLASSECTMLCLCATKWFLCVMRSGVVESLLACLMLPACCKGLNRSTALRWQNTTFKSPA